MGDNTKNLSRTSENTRSQTGLGALVKKGGVNTGSSADRPNVTISGQGGGCNTTQATPVSSNPTPPAATTDAARK